MMCKIVKEKHIGIKTLFIIFLAVIFIMFGSYSAKGINQGIYLCLEVLFPSLFPFMIIANLTVKSGICNYFSIYFSKITQFIFGVSGHCGATILLSLIGGYPIGAKGISELYKKNLIDEYTAKKLAYSLMSAGPGFLMVYIGIGCLSSIQIGICLLLSHILSVLILGFINKQIFRENKTTKPLQNHTVETDFSLALINSVKDSIYSIIELSSIVIFFSAIINIFEHIAKNSKLFIELFTILTEVTTASNMLCNNKNIIMLAFSTGFGGLCIHFQIFQSLGDIKINKLLFFVFRIFQGAIVTVFTYIFISVFKVSVPTFSTANNLTFNLSSSVIGSILLLLVGICFLYNLKNYKT